MLGTNRTEFLRVKLYPKAWRLILIFPPTLAPIVDIFRLRWLYAYNRWNIGVTHKGTHTFTDNVDYIPPAVDTINLVGIEVQQKSDRFYSDETRSQDEPPLRQTSILVS